MLGFVEVSTPKSYHCLLHKPQPLVRWQCVCMRTVYTLYFLMQEVHVCAQTSLCLSMSETNGSDIIPGVLYTVYSEVDACGRGLCVRVWRWAPDGWMVEIYGWTVALQRECVRRERDVWLKCCCFHTVTRLSHSRFVLDGVCRGSLRLPVPQLISGTLEVGKETLLAMITIPVRNKSSIFYSLTVVFGCEFYWVAVEHFFFAVPVLLSICIYILVHLYTVLFSFSPAGGAVRFLEDFLCLVDKSLILIIKGFNQGLIGFHTFWDAADGWSVINPAGVPPLKESGCTKSEGEKKEALMRLSASRCSLVSLKPKERERLHCHILLFVMVCTLPLWYSRKAFRYATATLLLRAWQ